MPLIQGRAQIEYRDIDSQPGWRQKYDVRVPVIEYDGQLVSEYPLDYAAVRVALSQIPDNDE